MLASKHTLAHTRARTHTQAGTVADRSVHLGGSSNDNGRSLDPRNNTNDIKDMKAGWGWGVKGSRSGGRRPGASGIRTGGIDKQSSGCESGVNIQGGFCRSRHVASDLTVLGQRPITPVLSRPDF